MKSVSEDRTKEGVRTGNCEVREVSSFLLETVTLSLNRSKEVHRSRTLIFGSEEGTGYSGAY